MAVRRAKLNDAAGLSVLVTKSAELVRDDLNSQGRLLVDRSHTPSEFARRLANPEYSIYCYVEEQLLVGMISIFQFEKIDQLFVDPRFFKRGIARQLWDHAYANSHSENKNSYFWVRSSSMAVPVYEKFGFIKSGTKQSNNGITFQLLELGG